MAQLDIIVSQILFFVSSGGDTSGVCSVVVEELWAARRRCIHSSLSSWLEGVLNPGGASCGGQRSSLLCVWKKEGSCCGGEL